MAISLSMFEPFLAPIAQAIYADGVLPELQSLAAKASSPDLKVVANALLAAVEAIAAAELPKA